MPDYLNFDDVVLIFSDSQKRLQHVITNCGVKITLEGDDCDFTAALQTKGQLSHYRKNGCGYYRFVPYKIVEFA